MNPNIALTHLTSAAAFAYILMWAQRWEKLPWITQEAQRITVIFRVFLAVVSSAGISMAWSGDSTAGWHVSIAIPPVTIMGKVAFHAFGQYALQHGWFKLFQLPEGQNANDHKQN